MTWIAERSVVLNEDNVAVLCGKELHFQSLDHSVLYAISLDVMS